MVVRNVHWRIDRRSGVNTIGKGANGDPLIECVGAGARIDNPGSVQCQIGQCEAHRTGDAGSICPLEFHPDSLSADFHDQVQFRSAVDGVKPCAVRLVGSEDFFQRKSFPGSSQLGMPKQVGAGMDAAKGVEKSGVAEIDFGRLDEALARICLPRKEPADHAGLLQGIKIGAGGVGCDTQRTGDLAAIPNLCVVVGEHHPKATHERGRARTRRPPDHAPERYG